MRLWAAQRLRETDPSTTDHILRIIVLATDFLDVAGPQYRKAYFDSQFPTIAIQISRQFHKLLTHRGTPLDIGVMALFPAYVQHGSAHVQSSLLLELLNNGLVNHLVDDLLSQRREPPSLWSHWNPHGKSGG
jgi:hypothetical protein